MGDLSVAAGRGEWSAKIIRTWRQSVESIIETGRLIQQAKDALAHGEFEKMIADELPFTASTAQRLMIIARDQRIANAARVQDLPPHWGTLYELTKLDDAAFEQKLKAGAIHSGMKRRDIAPAASPIEDDAIDMRSETIGQDGGRRQARGYDLGDGRKRIIITLDDDTFDQIEARARKAGVSFNEEAVTLLTWALEAYDRWEAEAGAA